MFIFLYVSHLYIYIYFKFLKENNANEKYEILIFFELAVQGSDFTVLTSDGGCPNTFLRLS